jgi:hypothetical protein
VPEPGSWKHSPIAADGTRDAHYGTVRRVNAEAKAVGDALGKAESVAVFHHGDSATVGRLASPVVPTGGQLTVGVFQNEDGKTLALVTNRDYQRATRTSVAVSPRGAQVEAFDPARKTWSPAAGDGQGGVLPDLAARGGVLLRW